MPSEPTVHKLAAILCADVVGYARLMAEDEAATVRTLTAYRDELSLLVGQHRGRVVDSPGDNLLAEFPSALDACRCAVEAQRVIQARNADLPDDRKMQFRIGVHLGDVMVEGERIFGDGINIAARLEALAETGAICISGTVHDQIRNKLDLVYEDLGEQRIENIPDPVRVYRMRPAPTARAGVNPDPAWGRLAKVAGAALLVVAAVWVALRVLTPESTPLPLEGSAGAIGSIAVLPLENLSGDPEQEYFTDGMTGALIAELGKLGKVRVISRTSVMRFKGAQVPIGQIASILNVDGIVEGSVLRADDRVRITAQLIDARRDSHLWAQSYERELNDILTLQGEVARAIAGRIELQLAPHAARLAAAPRVGPDAHEAYLKGRYFAWQHTATGSRKAVEYLQEAIRLAPEWARAYSGLADTLSCAPTHAWSNVDSPNWPSNPREVMAMAEVNASRAIELDSSLSEAHNSVALVKMFGDWDWTAAEESLRRAIELDPSYQWAHHVYALLLALTGRLDKALVEMQRTFELDPLSVNAIVALGDVYAWRGEGASAGAPGAVRDEPRLTDGLRARPRGPRRAGRDARVAGEGLRDPRLPAALRRLGLRLRPPPLRPPLPGLDAPGRSPRGRQPGHLDGSPPRIGHHAPGD